MQKGIIKNVNKLTGEPINAKDLASMLSGIIGNESGVLTVFDELRLEKISDNKVRLHSGVYSLKGHILYIPKGSYEDFEIESGTLGANRIDLLVAEYVKNGEGDGEDTLRFRVIKGEATSGTPKEPSLIQQDINENGITYQEALYAIKFKNQGISISSRSSKIKNNQHINSSINERIDNLVKVRKQGLVSAKWDVIEIGNAVVQIGSTEISFDTSKFQSVYPPVKMKEGFSATYSLSEFSKKGQDAALWSRGHEIGVYVSGNNNVRLTYRGESRDIKAEIYVMVVGIKL